MGCGRMFQQQRHDVGSGQNTHEPSAFGHGHDARLAPGQPFEQFAHRRVALDGLDIGMEDRADLGLRGRRAEPQRAAQDVEFLEQFLQCVVLIDHAEVIAGIVDHRQRVHVERGHLAHDLRQRRFGADGDGVLRHQIAHMRIGEKGLGGAVFGHRHQPRQIGRVHIGRLVELDQQVRQVALAQRAGRAAGASNMGRVIGERARRIGDTEQPVPDHREPDHQHGHHRDREDCEIEAEPTSRLVFQNYQQRNPGRGRMQRARGHHRRNRPAHREPVRIGRRRHHQHRDRHHGGDHHPHHRGPGLRQRRIRQNEQQHRHRGEAGDEVDPGLSRMGQGGHKEGHGEDRHARAHRAAQNVDRGPAPHGGTKAAQLAADILGQV